MHFYHGIERGLILVLTLLSLFVVHHSENVQCDFVGQLRLEICDPNY
jgi:hypothetical protein